MICRDILDEMSSSGWYFGLANWNDAIIGLATRGFILQSWKFCCRLAESTRTKIQNNDAIQKWKFPSTHWQGRIKAKKPMKLGENPRWIRKERESFRTFHFVHKMNSFHIYFELFGLYFFIEKHMCDLNCSRNLIELCHCITCDVL